MLVSGAIKEYVCIGHAAFILNRPDTEPGTDLNRPDPLIGLTLKT